MIETSREKLIDWTKAEKNRIEIAAEERLYGLRIIAERSNDFEKIKEIVKLCEDLEDSINNFLGYCNIEYVFKEGSYPFDYLSNFIYYGNRVVELCNKEI